MKIAYLATADTSKENGVIKKIHSQAKTWISYGNNVRVFVLSPNARKWAGLNSGKVDYRIFPWNGVIIRAVSWWNLIYDIMEWKPSLIYYRSGLFYPGFLKLATRFPTVAEINTLDSDEYRIVFSFPRYIYHSITRHKIFSSCKGLVCVTNELADKYSRFGKPIAVVSNGIDLSVFPSLPPTNNNIPRLVFLGTPGFPWHGIEKIISLANICGDFNFDIIGYNENDIQNKIPHNVSLHGILESSQYEKILLQGDVGIGSLSVHVKNMNEGCPLKVREYLAYGLPVIIGYKDTDIPDGVPYALSIPNTPDNVIRCSDKIQEFARIWLGKRVPREQIMHIDIRQKEKTRLDFMYQCLG